MCYAVCGSYALCIVYGMKERRKHMRAHVFVFIYVNWGAPWPQQPYTQNTPKKAVNVWRKKMSKNVLFWAIKMRSHLKRHTHDKQAERNLKFSILPSVCVELVFFFFFVSFFFRPYFWYNFACCWWPNHTDDGKKIHTNWTEKRNTENLIERAMAMVRWAGGQINNAVWRWSFAYCMK